MRFCAKAILMSIITLVKKMGHPKVLVKWDTLFETWGARRAAMPE